MESRAIYYITISLAILTGYSAKKQDCFAANYVISCLTTFCEFGGGCPGDPEAVCRIERPNKCSGCKQVWYSKDGTKAKCGSRQNLKLCPGGEPVVHCEVDSCKWPCTHPAFKDKPCRQSFCGKCRAEYFIANRWLKCPISTTGFSGETLPVDLVVRESPTKPCMLIPCPLDACVGESCHKFPKASCRPDGCRKCQPTWYLGNRPVDCISGEIAPPEAIEAIDPVTGNRRVCAGGEPLMPCNEDVCFGETCRNYPQAVCRPDGCGQCKATWYMDNVLVDCLSTECPANVIRYTCFVDPCIYFSHYCPAAECRASDCGRCEAKYFVDNREISCTQPPKQCAPGENTMVCPWFTCPSTICPSDLNLMCRINPCGLSCTHEWVNFKTGMIGTCRTTDKIITTNTRVEKIFMEDPLSKFFGTVSEVGKKPYIEVEKKPVTKPLVTQVHWFEPVQMAPISEKVTLPVDKDTLGLKPDPQSGSPDIGSGKIIMLGGNDVEFNNLLLDLLGANKLQLPPVTKRKLGNVEMQRPVHLPAAEQHLPVAKKAGKPILRTRNSRFGVKSQKSVLNQLATTDQQFHGVDVVKESPVEQIHLELNSMSTPDKIRRVSKKKAGKPKLHPDQTSVSASKPKQPDLKPKNSILRWKKAGKPNFNKPLYPELELIPKGDANTGQAMPKRTHISSPVKKDSAQIKPVAKPKPILTKL